MIQIYNSDNIYFENSIFKNNTGLDNLVNCIESTSVIFFNCSWLNTFTYSANIIYIIYSNFSMSNSYISYFYPNFIFCSFCQINLRNNVFNNSIEKTGVFKIGAIYFQYNVSFSITNNNFLNIKNSSFGSVNYNINFNIFIIV